MRFRDHHMLLGEKELLFLPTAVQKHPLNSECLALLIIDHCRNRQHSSLLQQNLYFYLLPCQDLPVCCFRNNFGFWGLTLFSFAHIVIGLSASSAVVHLLHTLQQQYGFRKWKILNIFSLRLLSEIKPTILAKQNSALAYLSALPKDTVTSQVAVPDVSSRQFQIFVYQTDVTFQNTEFALLAHQPSCLGQTSFAILNCRHPTMPCCLAANLHRNV